MSAHPAVHPPEQGPHVKLPAVLEHTEPLAVSQLCVPVEHSLMSAHAAVHPPEHGPHEKLPAVLEHAEPLAVWQL